MCNACAPGFSGYPMCMVDPPGPPGPPGPPPPPSPSPSPPLQCGALCGNFNGTNHVCPSTGCNVCDRCDARPLHISSLFCTGVLFSVGMCRSFAPIIAEWNAYTPAPAPTPTPIRIRTHGHARAHTHTHTHAGTATIRARTACRSRHRAATTSAQVSADVNMCGSWAFLHNFFLCFSLFLLHE